MKILPALFAIALGGCTAIKVVTHSSDSDPQNLPAGHYRLDPQHWSLSFDVDHFGFSRFVMRFDRAQIDLDFAPDDPERSQVSAAIEAASIDSRISELDQSLRDLLDPQHHPDIRFVSRSLHRTSPGSGEMTGDLTIKDVTRPVTLAVSFRGGGVNPLTNEDTLGFFADGAFDRSDFGLIRWYPAVGNRITLHIEAELVRETE